MEWSFFPTVAEPQLTAEDTTMENAHSATSDHDNMVSETPKPAYYESGSETADDEKTTIDTSGLAVQPLLVENPDYVPNKYPTPPCTQIPPFPYEQELNHQLDEDMADAAIQDAFEASVGIPLPDPTELDTNHGADLAGMHGCDAIEDSEGAFDDDDDDETCKSEEENHDDDETYKSEEETHEDDQTGVAQGSQDGDHADMNEVANLEPETKHNDIISNAATPQVQYASTPTITSTSLKLKALQTALAKAPANTDTIVPDLANSNRSLDIAIEREQLDEEMRDFNRIKKAYERKKTAGRTTREDDIIFLKREKENNERTRRHNEILLEELESWNQDASDEEEQDQDAAAAARESTSPFTDDHLDREWTVDDTTRTQTSKPKKPRQAKRAVGESGPATKAGRKRKAEAAIESSNDPPKPKRGRPAKATGPKKTKKQLREEAREQREADNVTNIASMYTNNVFQDIQGNTARSEQPTFQSKYKRDALNQLLSSLPAECRDEAKMDKEQVAKATRVFGQNRCRADGAGGWHILKMISSLTHYQMLGASFMREREKGEEAPIGGILADQMGLGKTVMCLAVVVNGKAADKSRKDIPAKDRKKPTLIVAPSTLLHQWEEEIKKHVEQGELKVIRWHSKAKLQTQNVLKDLNRYDIILTTYNEIQRSVPKWAPPLDLVTYEQKKAWWMEEVEKKKGILHRVDYNRVILDEAQAIKNAESQTSIACRLLNSKIRWCVTGTPVQNGLIEFYPIFRFLRVPFTGSMAIFRENFLKPNSKSGIERLHCMLRSFMIRRTHGDQLFGAKLLTLPETSKYDLPCHFSTLERSIYEVVRKRFVNRVNVIIKQRKLQQNYSHILVMLLRLRQMVGHVLLIHDCCIDLLEPEDFNQLKRIASEPVPPQSDDAAILKHLRQMLRDPAKLPRIDTNMPAEATNDANTDADAANAVGSDFGRKNNYGEYLEHVQKQVRVKEVEDAPCSKCSEIPNEPHLTSCGHVYCYPCLLDITTESVEEKRLYSICVVCGSEFSGARPHAIILAERLEAEEIAKEQIAQAQRKRSPAARWKKVIDEWISDKGYMLPSTKTQAVKAQLLNWFQDDPTDKVIIYTQFLPIMHILSKMCDMEGWVWKNLHGGQNIDDKAKTIEDFGKDPNIRVMICSLRTGGTGLNLVMANRVINFDLWWNSSVEDQAFCRTYRRGQERETSYLRVIVENTIDADMVGLQEAKNREIGSIMAPDTGAKPSFKKKLSMTELLKLFGEGVDTEEEQSDPTDRFIIARNHTEIRKEEERNALDVLDDLEDANLAPEI